MCIERIVDLNQMHLSVESKIEAADAHKRRRYLSESNFINLYTFAGVLNGMWSCVDEWKKDKETGSIEKFLSDKKRVQELQKDFGTLEKEERDFLRQHKYMIKDYDYENQLDISEEAVKKNYDRLGKAEQDKDTNPIECMLVMLKLFDGLRIYRLN